MTDIEKRARELLAAAFEEDGNHPAAKAVRDGEPMYGMRFQLVAISAIIASLTLPEGFVLVPVELPVEMEVAFMETWVSKRRCVDDPEMQDAWAAALAARPEVP